MKNIIIAFQVVVFIALAGPSIAQMGVSAGEDLDALYAQAQKQYDLADEDAVLLLQSRQMAYSASGELVTRVHQVVWIGTGLGIRSYADLRVPWNTATSDLEVEVLRTWREGQWWPAPDVISETAVVHTLPHALDHADDYTGMRESMLLHDGVELPCIMETVYSVTERGLPGADGVFVFPRLDPAVRTQLTVAVPATMPLQHAALNGAPVPVDSTDAGVRSLTWTMEMAPPLGLPHTAGPAGHEPAVVWSTWEDWVSLRDHWREIFDSALVPGTVLTDTLHARLAEEPSAWGRLETVVGLVNDSARPIPYSDHFWRYAPRTAERTWSTAYGHDLDRAVLAAALLAEAGFEAVPMFVGDDFGLVAPEIPRLAGMGGLHLLIKKPSTIFDPATGALVRGVGVIGRPLWRTDEHFDPFVGHSAWEDNMALDITLEPDPEGGWRGQGYLDAGGVFSPYNDMAGPGARSRTYLTGMLGSVLAGAELVSYNPEIFNQYQVACAFTFTLAAIEPDDHGRREMLIAGLQGGLREHLPGDVHLYDETRQSPVRLPVADMRQRVRVRLRTGDEPVHHPADLAVTNAAGAFALTSTTASGWLTIERTLQTKGEGTVDGALWPELRRLLLEDDDSANGRLLFQ